MSWFCPKKRKVGIRVLKERKKSEEWGLAKKDAGKGERKN